MQQNNLKCLFLIAIIQILLPALCYAQNTLSQSNNLQQADSLVEAGKQKQAFNMLNSLVKKPLAAADIIKAKVLLARILNENGNRVMAIQQLRSTLATGVLNAPPNVKIKTDAYLVLAECYFGLFKMEEFKNISDTVLQLATRNHLKNFYKAKAYINMARYYAYQIVPNTGKPYLDSARYLYNTAAQKEKKFYNPVSFYTASINIYRNLDDKKVFVIADTAIKLINKGYNRERYNQNLLWRAIGNANIDQTRNKDPRVNRRWYPKSLVGYQMAATILKSNYPSNKIDLLYLNNLIGLLNYQCRFFKLAEKYFDSSKAILKKNNFSIAQYTFAYSNTYLWESGVKDSIYTGRLLVKKKKEELVQWLQLAPYWQNWQMINQSKSLHYFRENYAKSPYEDVIRICYQLYQTEKDKKYLDLAFSAQESSKNYFLKDEYKCRNHIAEPILPQIQAIQKHLRLNEAIISFSDLTSYYDYIYAIVISADTVSIQKINFGNLKKRFGQIQISDSVCNNLSHFKKYYYAAYQAFFDPIKTLLGNRINHLLVYSSTLSSIVKFDMMVSDTLGIRSFGSLPYLRNKYIVNYDFSYQFASMRSRLKKQNGNVLTNLQAYIPSYTNTIFYSLPFFNKSGNVLKTTFGFNVFNQSNSTIPNYQLSAGKANIIQIAGHCFSDAVAAENLKIVMDSSHYGESRFLTINEIINTKLQADLTVLSLCQTGMGDIRVTDSYLNMAYWFTYAGSKSCLFSYWKLDDRSASFIVEKFYHYLSAGMKKSDALRSAQKDYLAQTKTEEEKNPVYWGGLTIIGDDSPVKLVEKKAVSYYFAVFLTIPLSIFLVKRRKKSNNKLPKTTFRQ